MTIKNDIDFSPDTLLHLSFSTHLKLTTACQIPNQNRGWEEVKRSESCSLHLYPLRFMNKARTIKSYHSLPRKKGTFWPFPQNETLEISFGPSSSPILLLPAKVRQYLEMAKEQKVSCGHHPSSSSAPHGGGCCWTPSTPTCCRCRRCPTTRDLRKCSAIKSAIPKTSYLWSSISHQMPTSLPHQSFLPPK